MFKGTVVHGKGGDFFLERSQKYQGRAEKNYQPGGRNESDPFGLWLRFNSVTGRCGHAPSLKPRQSPKVFAPRWP